MNHPRSLFTPAALAAFFLASLAATSLGAAPPLDLNADQIPDIWAMRHDSGGLSPMADTDGDGQDNLAEAVAGTDPAKPDSTIKIIRVSVDATGVHLTFPTNMGKRYQVQTATTLAGPVWSNFGTPMLPDASGILTASNASAEAASLFYRVSVIDIDSDGDGVNDWEEMQVGFDPYNSHSHGLNGTGDLAAITQGMSSPNTINVTATAQRVTEPPSGNVSTGMGTFVIMRSGGLGSVSVNYAISGSAVAGADYVAPSGSVAFAMGANTATVNITPLPDTLAESPELVILTISAGATHTVGSTGLAAVVIDDYIQATGTGLSAQFFNEGVVNGNTLSSSNAPTFSIRVLSRTDAAANFDYTVTAWPGAPVNATQFASRWTGEVLPEFAQTYTFYTDVNAAGRLWVNGQLLTDNWPRTGFTTASGEASGIIEMLAGRRYSIVFEHYEVSGNNAKAKLSWASANQAKQVIPQTRLFPNAAPQIFDPLDVLLIKGSGNYSYQINASGLPTGYSAAGLPAGWSINATSGLVTISTAAAGAWQIPLTATNANGSGSAILSVTVIATDGVITRDVWTGLPGNSVGTLPLTTPPTITGTLTSLEAPQNAGDEYGARIRGYITAPSTGTYQFWLTGDEAAELWISDDDDVVNSFKRAQLIAPSAYRDWAAGAPSPLLLLQGGKRYFVEVRHKEGAGADHVSVGWRKPGDPGTLASEVVPGYALSQYSAPTGQTSVGTLYFANLAPQGSVITTAAGTAMLRVSGDETTAILTVNYSNLSSMYFGMHIHDDRIPNPPGGLSNVICDIDQPGDATPQPDGTYLWHISPRAGLSVSDLVTGIKTGHAYFNVHSTTNPNGEIKGYFRVLDGSQTFTPPPAPPSVTDDHTNRNAASRFLIQATFGPTQSDLNAANANSVLNLGYDGWITYQSGIPATHLFPYVFGTRNQNDPQSNPYSQGQLFSAWWRSAITAQDQLRHRVAFALSEILVTSEDGPLDERSDALSSYYDVLLDHSFGNFRNLLKAVTLHPAMGRYLDMLRSKKPYKGTGRIPNENYAREIKQLFSIGLNRLHPDGSLILNAKGELIPTYDQDAIIGFAHVFTGWDYFYSGSYQVPGAAPNDNFGAAANWINPMREVPLLHFTGQKRLLNNVVLPGLTTAGGAPLDPYAAHASAQYNDPAYQALPMQELDAAHDALFNHPNCGPFICRQLIQRLVTSTPSPAYIYRVVSAFNNNGSGVRGDLLAVVKSILLDYEARSPSVLTQQGFGKQREPVARVAAIARGFATPVPLTGTYNQTGSLVTITTASPHFYTTTGTVVPLEFADSSFGDDGSPLNGNYAITTVDATHFTIRTKTHEAATYQQGGAITRLTTTGNGFYPGVGETVQVEYLTGTPTLPASGTDAIEYRSNDSLTIILAGATAKRGTYSQTVASLNTLTITAAAHAFAAGSNVHVDFITSTAASPVSGSYTINTVTANTFTITTADAVARTGTAITIPAADVLAAVSGTANVTRLGDAANRTGNMVVTYSDWGVDTTNTDLNQTPLQSPTVFNFFLPDYQYPGILSNAGLITPEFQLTSETSVIRQTNFIYNGIYNDALSQSGLGSFKSGARDIMLDLRPWMATGPGGLPWAHNSNLAALIDELSTHLMGGQLSAAAKTEIRTHVQSLAYTTPSTTQLRDRVRSVVLLLTTSPDFTIQK